MEALTKPTPAEALAHLGRLLERYPHDLAALQTQGRLLNDRRDHVAALDALERARALAPHSARTLVEIARAWFRLDEAGRARALLEEAIRVSPRFLPAWLSLLRLLGFTRSPDGPAWAERAESLFPALLPGGAGRGSSLIRPDRAARGPAPAARADRPHAHAARAAGRDGGVPSGHHGGGRGGPLCSRRRPAAAAGLPGLSRVAPPGG